MTKKEQVAMIYDQKGREAAIKKGLELGLAKGTLSSWIGTWSREDRAA